MLSKIYITEIKPSDYDKVVEITKDIFDLSSFRVDENALKLIGRENVHKVSIGILENATSTFIAVSGNRIIGFLSWSFDKVLTKLTSRGYYKIKLFGVDKDYQRKGVGSQLLSYFLDYVKKRKGDIVEVSTDVDNLPATGIYQKFGFKYTSSFTTLRFYGSVNMDKTNDSVKVVRVVNVKDFDELIRIRSKNFDPKNYPIQCLFDSRIEDKLKDDILYNYHTSIQSNPNIFRVYVAFFNGKSVGYGAIKEDFSLSSLLSRISSKQVVVYRIFDLFVDKEYTRNGIGYSLVVNMIKDIPKGYDFIECLVPSHNYAMVNTLLKVGFRVSHIMLNFAK
ncbi:MAG: GNAT family N-acetyltransferase [Brevinematales bacterium]|nr:GNAT family N-acetyltransferase [Brevinematales bacterium]